MNGRRVAAAAAVIALTAGTVLAAGPVPPAGAAPAPQPTPSSTVEGGRGAELYLRDCASCHAPRGQGTQRGPALAGVGPASVDFQLSTGRMPLRREERQPAHRTPVYPAADIQAIVAYVAGFGPGGPPIPSVAPGELTTGRQLFLANCAACHSATGGGAALTNAWIAPSLDRATPLQVAEAVRVGPGLMPEFPPSVLTDRQVDAIATYVQELRGDKLNRGGASLGRLGPATEGLVGWAIGLVLLVLAARYLGSRAAR
jgi:ubiquinol-cytochrome c reductase cytochrome c subunit